MRLISFLSLILLVLPSSGFAAKCELKKDSSSPRKHSIRMPDGRIISIVPHNHPWRNDPRLPKEKKLPTMEGQLHDYFAIAHKLPGGKLGDEMRRQIGADYIKKWLKKEESTLKHFSEDYKTLEKSLESHPYGVVGLENDLFEMGPNISRRNPKFVIDEMQKLVDVGVITESEAQSILSIHLTPAGLLKAKRPELMKNSKIRGLARDRTLVDKEAESQAFCKKHSFTIGHTYSFPKKIKEALDARLPGEEKAAHSGAAASLHENITGLMMLEANTFGKVKPEDFLKPFQSSSGITLNNMERKILIDEAQELIEWLNGPSCHIGDYNEVQLMLSQKQSLIYFVGSAHLKSFKNYLEASCRDLRGDKLGLTTKGQEGFNSLDH